MASDVCGMVGWDPANADEDRNPDFHELRCMNFTSKGTREILVAGCLDNMFKIDVEKGTITETVSTSQSLSCSANLCSSWPRLSTRS